MSCKEGDFPHGGCFLFSFFLFSLFRGFVFGFLILERCFGGGEEKNGVEKELFVHSYLPYNSHRS